MHEPEYYNNTPFEAQILPYVDRYGYDARLIVIKASYAIGPSFTSELLEEQRPLRLGDEPWDDPKLSDNRFPSDLCEFKPGTDVLVVGHAVTPLARPVRTMDVAVSLAGRTRSLRVHGPRYWTDRMVGVGISDAEPVERVPMRWQLAYGGLDASDPERILECKENPAGRGIARQALSLRGLPAPQIELANEPVRSANQSIKPAGLGPLGPTFEPRRGRAGTYDKHWLEEVHPAKPHDYQPAFEHVAPREFVFEKPLRGGEEGGVAGMTPEGRLLFKVPVERPFVEWTIDGKPGRAEPHLDTVIIDTDEKVMELVHRVCIRAPTKMRNRFTRVEVFHKQVLSR